MSIGTSLRRPGTRPGAGLVRDGRARSRVAAAIAAAAWGLAALAVTLLVLARPTVDQNLLLFLVDVTVACTYGLVAAVTLARRAHPVPWLLALAAVGGGLAAFSYAYGAWSQRPGGLPPNLLVEQLHNTAWVPGTFGLFVVVPWLVRDHRLGRAGWGVGIGVALTVGLTVAAVRESPLFMVLLAAAVAFGLVSAACVELRRRRGPVGERIGLGWLALGTAILAGSFVPLLLPWGPVPLWVTPVLHLTSQAVFPAAVLVVVLRNRMWGLGLVVSRAALAGTLTALLLGLYLATTLAVATVLPGQRLAQLVGAGVVAVAVQPARIWLGARVHRLVYGEAADPARAVRRLGSQLVGSASVEELLSGLAEDIGHSMRLESVAVLARGLAPVQWGRATETPTVHSLQHRGEDLGTVAVSPLPGESLSARDLTTLRDLCSVLAAATAVARTAADVEALRGRLAAVRMEERRVIRREIHDGIGPSLAGINLGLRGAMNLLDTDPPGAAQLLARLQQELDGAVSGVRSLSHHLLPPVLDELGLGAALTELVERHAGSTMSVTAVTDGLGELDPAVAVAAYGITSEAVTNAARHADAGQCRVRAVSGPEGLLIEVSDDGTGVAVDAVPGVGTRSMRERATEQGGTLEILDGAGGGTVVRALLPQARRG